MSTLTKWNLVMLKQCVSQTFSMILKLLHGLHALASVKAADSLSGQFSTWGAFLMSVYELRSFLYNSFIQGALLLVPFDFTCIPT